MDFFVGYSTAELLDEQIGTTLSMAVMYPTDVPSVQIKLGPFGFNVAMDAPPTAGVFPLIIISHGSGGAHLLYRTLAHYLASHGFIVGLPEHPFNNRKNNAWNGKTENLINRPRHISLAIDWFGKHTQFAQLLQPAGIAVIGHSMGGYTALAVAGGLPTSLPKESVDGRPQPITVTPDRRVKALVLLAPASGWFMADGALKDVHCPILMLVGTKDEITPFSRHGQLILDGVPDSTQVQYRLVENAGHFSFLSPYPPSLTTVVFPPSQDPPGFDRKKFHEELNVEILDFLQRTLSVKS